MRVAFTYITRKKTTHSCVVKLHIHHLAHAIVAEGLDEEERGCVYVIRKLESVCVCNM